MKVYIRAHDLDERNDDVFSALKSKGLCGVQLVAYKAYDCVKYEEGGVTAEFAFHVKDVAERYGAEIPLLGAYFNPVHPDEAKATKGERIFSEYLGLAKCFGASLVGSETGSYNGDKWTYNPLNRTDEALDKVVGVFTRLARRAEACGVDFAIEGAYGHVCYSPERLYEAAKRIGSDRLYFIFDLFNYLYEGNFECWKEILHDGLVLLGDRVRVVHLKDFVVCDGKLVQCSVGKGILDYGYILNILNRYCPGAALVLEGTKGMDAGESVEYLKISRRQKSETSNTLQQSSQ